MIKKSIELFKWLEDFILALSNWCDDQEVKEMCKEYCKTFLILGNLFSNLPIDPPVHEIYLENAKINIVALKNKYLDLTLLITPKAYATFNYLIPHIILHSYLSPYIEDFIE